MIFLFQLVQFLFDCFQRIVLSHFRPDVVTIQVIPEKGVVFFRQILSGEGYILFYLLFVFGSISLYQIIECELHHIFVFGFCGLGEGFVPILGGNVEAVYVDIRQMNIDNGPLPGIRVVLQEILQTVDGSRNGGSTCDRGR